MICDAASGEPIDQSVDVDVESVDVDQASLEEDKTLPKMKSQTEEDKTLSEMKTNVQELRHHLHSWRTCADVGMVMQDLEPDSCVFLQQGFGWSNGK